VPLLTGPAAGANFGVVVTFRPEELVFPAVLAALEELLLDEPLLEEPQPASAISATHAVSAGRRVRICTSTLAYTGSSMRRSFLTGAELSATELGRLLARALELKDAPLSSAALEGRNVALVFEKPSTRTRLSFEVGVDELGGHPLILRADELQLSRGEAVRDTALVLSRHVAAVGVRTGSHAMLEELAEYASIPVINMLTALHHPCQALADLLTLREAYGSLAGLRLAYVGDGNNVARSLAILGTLAGVDVAIASPPGYALEADLALPAEATGKLTLHTDAREAVAGACAVYTDVWVSMGDEQTADARRRDLADYRVDDALLDAAADGAFAMHDLPAHPGEEITAELLYGERQRIWDQAENRRHAQKALLELLLAEPA
jgi:ornithine carbamoyltransferase